MSLNINIYYLNFSNIFLRRERERETLIRRHFRSFTRVIYLIKSFFQNYSHINHTSLVKYPQNGNQLFIPFLGYFYII
jgi:hypothetical protein